eukprot:gene9755-11392_t
MEEIEGKQLDTVNLEEEEEEGVDDFYIHIDIIRNSTPKAKSAINKFMIDNDSYDPRRGLNFPTDLLEDGKRDTLANRRNAIGVSSGYYEFWKVRKNFPTQDFRKMVQSIQDPDVEVRLVVIRDNEHSISTNNSSEKY